jgi:predicted aspartyl protease
MKRNDPGFPRTGEHAAASGAMKKMGIFHVGCKVENHCDPKKTAVVPKLLVDTGSDFTWLPRDVLKRIGIEPVKKDLQIQMANGQIVTRTVGYAILRVDKYETTDEVVFGQRGDLALLGSRALKGMNLAVDARGKGLVAARRKVAARVAGVVGMARCAVQRRVQRRNELTESFVPRHSFRPLLRGRGHRLPLTFPAAGAAGF